MNIIFYQTKTLFSNTGDALINKALISCLRNFGKIVANGEKNIPESFLKELGLQENEVVYCKSEIDFVLKILTAAVRAFLKGDKVFLFSGLGHTHGGTKERVKRNYIAGLILGIYRLFGVKPVRLGLTLGPVTKGMGTSEKFRSRFIHKYWVRDSFSLETCNNLKINKAEILPDMSWYYQEDSPREFNDSNTVVVNLKQVNLEQSLRGDVQEKTLNKLINALGVLDNGVRIIVCYQVASDKDMALQVYEELCKAHDNVELINEQLTLGSAQSIYSQAAYVFSNRMHSLLFSYKYGALPIPVINAEKHKKITCAYTDNDLGELILDVFKDGIDEFQNIHDKRDELYRKLIDVEEENTRIIEQNLEELLLQ